MFKKLLMVGALAALLTGTAAARQHIMKIDDAPGKRVVKLDKDPLPRHLNLTDEQKKAFKKLDLGLQKEILPLRNELGVKRLELEAEKIEEKPDLKKINILIDDIHRLAAAIEKKEAAVDLQKRALLDAEQRRLWDEEPPFGRRLKLMLNRFGPDRLMWLGDEFPGDWAERLREKFEGEIGREFEREIEREIEIR